MISRNRQPLAVTLVTLALASMAIHCDRGIEPFDPNEEPAAPDLARIYPNGPGRKAAPMGGMGGVGNVGGMGAGMPSGLAPARRNNTAPVIASVPTATISGTVELDGELYSDRPANGMLFIIARTSPAGPPLAVLRVPTPSFPHAFEIGQAQVMIPTLQFAGEIKLSARLDSDGNATTKLPGDLVGSVANSLVPGSQGVVLVLDEKL